MGHMKNLSQMIEDGSFEQDFMPLYEAAIEKGHSFVSFHGKAYSIYYADALVSIYKKVKTQGINSLKIIEWYIT